MERPPALPEGTLIRRAREASGLTVPAAAQAAAMSKARWTQVETGYETRQGQVRRVKAKPGTIARMAHAVGLDPDRLEADGERPDAAEILREILRTPPSPPAAGRPLTAVPPPPVLPDEPTDQQVAQFIIRQQDDDLVLDLWRAWTFRAASREQRLAMVRELSRDPAEIAAEIDAEDRGEQRHPGHREQALTIP